MHSPRQTLILRSFLFIVSSFAALAHAASPEPFYIGTYTGPRAKGVYRASLDPDTGAIAPPVLAAETANPSYLAWSSDGNTLYAVNEIPKFEGTPAGSVTAWHVKMPGGELEPLDRQSSGGRGPCHLSVVGKYVLAANYVGGSIVALPIGPQGQLAPASSVVQHTGHSIVAGRQEEPHAHHITAGPDGKYIFATDLGTDTIKVYRLDLANGNLVAEPARDIAVKPGTGPRRVLFDRSGEHIYILGEIASNVSVYSYRADTGATRLLQTASLLPADWKGANLAAEFRLDPSGSHLYASNRGQDTLATFTIAEDGRLNLIQSISCGGRTPRNFVLDPTGNYLVCANQDSANLAVFRVDRMTGRLSFVSSAPSPDKPVCLLFQNRL